MTSINSQQNEINLAHDLKRDSQASFSWLLSFEFFLRMLLVLTAIIALFFFGETARLMPVHGENMTAESSTVLIAQRWAQGLPLYTDFRKPPFLIAPFPPGLYAMLAAAYKIGIHSVQSLMFLGRWLSLLSLLGIGCLAYLWSRSRGFIFSGSRLPPPPPDLPAVSSSPHPSSAALTAHKTAAPPAPSSRPVFSPPQSPSASPATPADAE